MVTPFILSEDNIELQFATNHVGETLHAYSTYIIYILEKSEIQFNCC